MRLMHHQKHHLGHQVPQNSVAPATRLPESTLTRAENPAERGWSHAGRVDDVINVSGHRIGTAEVEGALCHNPKCAEAAVVPVDHPIKGQAIYAFVTLMVVCGLPSLD